MTATADPRLAVARAQALVDAGRLAEAESEYLQLLARWPQLTDTWYNLARLQRRLGKFSAALASYQRALDLGISQPEEVHLNRGVIYSDGLHQPDLAERELHTALALNPGYVPALFNLANLDEDLGRREQALARYEQILTLEPQYHEALARYASLKLAAVKDDALLARVRTTIASADTSAADRASLGFALGKSLDAQGQYDEAFNSYADANRASRAMVPPNTRLYDRERHERLIDELIATFDQPSAAGPAAESPRPVFICGMFRSGSTLTEQVLAAHSEVTAGGELPFMPTLAARELAPFPARMRSLDEARLRQLAQSYRSALRQLFPGATLVTDKRPDNFLYVGLIKRLFPDAKIVHTTRHAVDNCLSIYFLHVDPSMGYAFDLEDIAHYYTQYRRLMTHWQALYPHDILEFDYDRFVREQRSATTRLLEFCGLDWEDACLSFHEARTAVRTASVWQVRQPVHRQSSGRWAHYAAHIESLRAYLRKHHLAD